MAEAIASNPFVDVSVFLFFEDISDKQGVEGFTNYIVGQAKSLAKSVPEEEYDNWEDFANAVVNGESVLSSFENIKQISSNGFVTKVCPFAKAIREYIKRLGNFNPVHMEATDHYNHTIQPSAAHSACMMHQTYRNEVAKRIKIGGKPLQYAQIAAKAYTGKIALPPESWKKVLLEKAGISETQGFMEMRENSCLYVLYVQE
jgi:dTDP-glucose pyrophosphorylase